MKRTILLAVILLASTIVAAQNTVIIIDNQANSNVTVQCEDSVCTVLITDKAERIYVGPSKDDEGAPFCFGYGTVTQQPHIAVQPYYISDGPNINRSHDE